MRRDDDDGGGLMSIGQVLAILLLTPLVLAWWLSTLGIDVVGPVIALAGGS
jgi:hypothetical protein